jgi:Aspartyl protease/Domain of unknown function (DUF4124)
MKWPSRSALLLVLASATMLAPPTASAQIYRWIDGQGDVHYSQGIDSVPPRLRAGAVIIGYDRPAAPEPSGVSTPAPPGTGRINFTPGQPIIVAVRINDTGSAQLMLDTGAARTVINPTVLNALGVSYANALRGSLRGVTGDAEVMAVKIDSIDVSGARYGPLLIVSHDTGFGPGRGDGLLGRDFLDNFTITIDNAAGIVTLTPR